MYEELVKGLRRAFCTAKNQLSNPYCFVPYYEKAADAIEELTLIAESYKRSMEAWADEAVRPKWISVKERLPEEGTWVLCQCRANIKDVLRWQDGYWFHDLRHQYMGGFVTHWMPLPERPKEESP